MKTDSEQNGSMHLTCSYFL